MRSYKYSQPAVSVASRRQAPPRHLSFHAAPRHEYMRMLVWDRTTGRLPSFLESQFPALSLSAPLSFKRWRARDSCVRTGPTNRWNCIVRYPTFAFSPAWSGIPPDEMTPRGGAWDPRGGRTNERPSIRCGAYSTVWDRGVERVRILHGSLKNSQNLLSPAREEERSLSTCLGLPLKAGDHKKRISPPPRQLGQLTCDDDGGACVCRRGLLLLDGS